MKRVSLICALVIVLLSACSTRLMLISDEEFSKRIKSVVVLPIYIGPEMFPPELIPLFPVEYRTKLTMNVISTKQYYMKELDGALANGKFKLRLVKADEKTLKEATRDMKYDKFDLIDSDTDKVIWQNTRSFLKEETVKALLQKYNVDAVVFPRFLVCKRWKRHDITNEKYVILPVTFLYFSVVITDGKNETVFDGRSRIMPLEEPIQVGDKYTTSIVPYEAWLMGEFKEDKIVNRMKEFMSEFTIEKKK